MRILVFCLFAPLLSFGHQPLGGSYREGRYNIDLTLSPEGRYQLAFQQQTSRGTYVHQGQQLTLQDERGGLPISYWISALDATQLILVDGNGLQMNFLRTEPPSPEKPSIPGGALVAEARGLSLRQGHLDNVFFLLEFLMGKDLTAKEKQTVRATVLEEFKSDPRAFLHDAGQLADALAVIKVTADPVQVGLLRQQIYAALYFHGKTLKPEEVPSYVQILNGHLKPLADDVQNGLVLTSKDADGLYRYLDFMNQLQGFASSWTPESQRTFRDTLRTQFYAMSLEQKQLACSASLLWTVLEGEWSKLTEAQRATFVAQYRQQSPSGLPPQTGGEASALSSSDALAQQQLVEMMSRMSLQSHMTSMNIIENMGGTGNYWEWVEHPY
jgi:hypothetical protein